MKKSIAKDLGILIIRVGIGLSFAFNHGYSKITGGPETWERLGANMVYAGLDFAHVFWGFMAAFAEFGGGLLLAFGLLTRPAALLIAVTMLIAILMHQAHGESFVYPLEMLSVAAGLALTGGGRYSLDAHIRLRR